MSDPIYNKYLKTLEKMENESTLKGLLKIPNICNKYKERYFEFERVLLNTKKESDPKKCLKIVKKVENSAEYIDFLENCLIHRFKDIEKIYKNYSKKIDKIILTKFKMNEYLSKKIQEYKDKGMTIRTNPSFEKKYIILENQKNKLFAEFMKKNKKALADLKKDKKAYITFFVIRHRLGCFVLP
jgi:hypothetical protein